MKIVYTSLQENDLGVKRSVRHLQVDLGKKTPDREVTSREVKLQGETTGSGKSLLSDNLLPAGRQKVDQPKRGEKVRSGDVGIAPGPPGPPSHVQQVGSLASYYIRKFVDIQLRTADQGESGSLINILV